MMQKKIEMNDWQIPFMLFELSSYAKGKEHQKQHPLSGMEGVIEMNNFFNEKYKEAARDFIWDDSKS